MCYNYINVQRCSTNNLIELVVKIFLRQRDKKKEGRCFQMAKKIKKAKKAVKKVKKVAKKTAKKKSKKSKR